MTPLHPISKSQMQGLQPQQTVLSPPTAGFSGEPNEQPHDMVKNVIPMFQVGKLRLRTVPSQSKSGVSASESRAPPSPRYLLDTRG